MTHYQIGLGPIRSLCGSDDGPFRCLAFCDHCETRVVDCPSCLHIAKQIQETLNKDLKEAKP